MSILRAALFLAVVGLAGCKEKPEDPAIDVCQVNVDCTMVQLDACCARSSCDEDLKAETSARTRQRLERCAIKDCAKSDAPCKSTGGRFASSCRDGRCVLEVVR
jgi:hypothetical protein